MQVLFGNSRQEAAQDPGRRKRTPRQARSQNQHRETEARRDGWTLIELLVSLATVMMLVQILVPALQAAREAARKIQCANNLRQLGLATLQHEHLQGAFPSGGWHFTWVGEPERGFGRRQPGGWAFSLLAYLEAEDVQQLGRGLSHTDRHVALQQRCQIAQPVFICPSRRDARAYPQTENQYPFTQGGELSVQLGWVAKSDYAACVGDALVPELDWRWQGPRTLEEGDDPRFEWPEMQSYNGVIYGRSQTRVNHIRDGAGKTYLLAEKYVNSLHYQSGSDQGDNENLYAGFDNDTCRSTRLTPRRDRAGLEWHHAFGSAHPSTWHALMCDGSLHRMTYDIDPELHRVLGTRNDQRPLELQGD